MLDDSDRGMAKEEVTENFTINLSKNNDSDSEDSYINIDDE